VPLLEPPFLGKFMHFWPYLTALRPNLFSDFFEKMVIYQYYGNVLIGQNYENEAISKKYDKKYDF
jgi:hypothetical protein